MIVLALIVGVLAVARITRLLTEDRLTIGYRRWVVKRTGEDSMLSYLVHCPWCMSLWVALPVMPLVALLPPLWTIVPLAPLAASLVTGLLLDGKE